MTLVIRGLIALVAIVIGLLTAIPSAAAPAVAAPDRAVTHEDLTRSDADDLWSHSFLAFPGVTTTSTVTPYDRHTLLVQVASLSGTTRAAVDGAEGAPLSLGPSDFAASSETPIAEGNAAHMFRNAPGHLADDTAAHRLLLEETVSPCNLVRTQPLGTNGTLQTFERTLPNGDIVWVEVRNGTAITNGGVNVAPPAS